MAEIIFEYSANFPKLFFVMTVLNIIIALIIIFLERKDGSATLAWILIMFIFPFIGLLLYITFSQNLTRRKIFKMTKEEDHFVTSALNRQISALDKGERFFEDDKLEQWIDLIRLNQIYAKSYFTEKNKIDIITDGKKKLDMVIEDIHNAKESINIEYFIIKEDIVGKRLFEAIIQKAKEGIKVKLLVDAMGSNSIKSQTIKEMRDAGVEVAMFFPRKWFFFNLNLNYRNHRKIVVIDDIISYVGGFNIAKEYLGLKKKFGYWRDTHLRIEGDGTQDLNIRFLQDWRFAADKKYEIDLNQVFFPFENPVGDVAMQVVSSGPDLEYEEIKRGFLKMITSATERIYIQTPYFVPDATILESLKMAAQSGVDVRLMIPNKPDHIFVYWATYSYVGELLKDGARVYRYDNGFLHAKTMVVDGEVATVGSANFDRRSFKLNFETNAFIYNTQASKNLEEEFLKDIEKSTELTKDIYKNRSLSIKIKEPIARLLSDIL